MSTYNMTINLDKKCSRCKKKGALESGICLSCTNKAIQRGEYEYIIKPRDHDSIFELMEIIVSTPPAPTDSERG